MRSVLGLILLYFPLPTTFSLPLPPPPPHRSGGFPMNSTITGSRHRHHHRCLPYKLLLSIIFFAFFPLYFVYFLAEKLARTNPPGAKNIERRNERVYFFFFFYFNINIIFFTTAPRPVPRGPRSLSMEYLTRAGSRTKWIFLLFEGCLRRRIWCNVFCLQVRAGFPDMQEASGGREASLNMTVSGVEL